MTVKFKAEIDFEKIKDDILEQVGNNLEIAASDQISIIQNNARKQQGYDGKFKPLSPRYKALKEKAGRVGKANLELTGQLMQSLQTKQERNNGKISTKIFVQDAPGNKSPIGDSKASVAEKAISNDETRPFLGLSEKDKDRIFNYIKRKLKI